MTKDVFGIGLERWRVMTEEWIPRARIMASLVPPGSRVLDVGAGLCSLRKFLHPDCAYVPLDFVEREPGTFICDLNSEGPLPEFPHADTAVMGGVFEYVYDVPRLLRHLPKTTGLVVASYAVFELRKDGESDENGWVNAFTAEEILREFEAAGFAIASVVGAFGKQKIIIARRSARTREGNVERATVAS